ncbi:Glycoside hydrolase superfamily [Naviculisporaceae sp. PSN 640]
MLLPSGASRLLSPTILLTAVASTCLAGVIVPTPTPSAVQPVASSSTPPPGHPNIPRNVEAQADRSSFIKAQKPTSTLLRTDAVTTITIPPTTITLPEGVEIPLTGGTTVEVREPVKTIYLPKPGGVKTIYAPVPEPSPVPAQPSPPAPPKIIDNLNKTKTAITPELPRLVLYFQTTHETSKRGKLPKPISMLPLITEKQIALTHLIICSLHVHSNGTIHLNDHPPNHPRYHTLWNETAVMKSAGVKVMAMVGGAAAGSFAKDTLDAPSTPSGNKTFEASYSLLHNTLRKYNLDGIDIDVEEPMSQFGITRLVRRLRADFGLDFIITLSPVATAIEKPPYGKKGAVNLSGFDYFLLDQDEGYLIDFYNAQFYNGWGDLGDNGHQYKRIINTGEWDPKRIVAGQLTSPDNGYGYVDFLQLGWTVAMLRSTFGEFGGIMGWEYFNGEPGGSSEPWRWAQEMTKILRPGLFKNLVVTRETAEGLVRSWRDSILGSASEFLTGIQLDGGQEGQEVDESLLIPDVDYLGMVNA